MNYSDAQENEHVIDEVDYVYYATGVIPNDSLFKDIKDLGIQVEKIGDVRKPQTVLDAISRAYKLGNSI